MRTIYDHLADQELLRLVQFNTDPLVRALCERLEMRLRDIEELEDHRDYPPGDDDGE